MNYDLLQIFFNIKKHNYLSCIDNENFLIYCNNIDNLKHDVIDDIKVLKDIQSNNVIKYLLITNKPIFKCKMLTHIDEKFKSIYKILNCIDCYEEKVIGEGNVEVKSLKCKKNKNFKLALKPLQVIIDINNQSKTYISNLLNDAIDKICVYENIHSNKHDPRSNYIIELTCASIIFDAPYLKTNLYFPQYIPLEEGWSHSQCVKIMTQLYDAILYLQTLEICHMDIKWTNILIYENINPKEFVIKLTDFDYSCRINTSFGDTVGTNKYMSWISINFFYKTNRFPANRHNDIWAFFIMCFESLYYTLEDIVTSKYSLDQSKYDELKARPHITEIDILTQDIIEYNGIIYGPFNDPTTIINFLQLLFTQLKMLVKDHVNHIIFEKNLEQEFLYINNLINLFNDVIKIYLENKDDTKFYQEIKFNILTNYKGIHDRVIDFLNFDNSISTSDSSVSM